MPTTKEDIRRMLQRGTLKGATHVIIVCDTFDHGDFPVLVMPGEDARKIADERDAQPMERVMEVYNMSLDLEEQINERRARNF